MPVVHSAAGDAQGQSPCGWTIAESLLSAPWRLHPGLQSPHDGSAPLPSHQPAVNKGSAVFTASPTRVVWMLTCTGQVREEDSVKPRKGGGTPEAWWSGRASSGRTGVGVAGVAGERKRRVCTDSGGGPGDGMLLAVLQQVGEGGRWGPGERGARNLEFELAAPLAVPSVAAGAWDMCSRSRGPACLPVCWKKEIVHQEISGAQGGPGKTGLGEFRETWSGAATVPTTERMGACVQSLANVFG